MTVEKDDACSTTVLDKDGCYESCEKGYSVVCVEEKWADANGDEKGKRFCKECLEVCLALRKDEDISQGLDELEVSD